MFTLHNGDCLQVMPLLEAGSIDAIITDLPYGTTACKWDTVIEFAPMWKEVKRVLKPNGAFITTASQPFTSALIMSNPSFFSYEWIWNKNKASNIMLAKKQPLKVHENIVVFGKAYNPQMETVTGKIRDIRKEQARQNRSDGAVTPKGFVKYANDYDPTLKYPTSIRYYPNHREKEAVLHPTQKPVALYEYLIKTYTNEGETVLDIAMGSGTTIEAAERTGRNSIGIEKDEGIFQSAVLRLKPFTPSNTACTGRLDSSATQSSFTAEGIPPAKASGAKRRQ